MIRLLIFLGLGLESSLSFAGPHFHQEVTSALQFLEHYQTTGVAGYDPGQWRARVTSYVPSLIGVGKFNEPFEEPSVFVAASVANALAELYFVDSSYEQIPPMIERAVAGFQKYSWGALFNFYPPTTFRGVKVRQPRYFYLARQWQGFANIPPDADTTSVTRTALHYNNVIKQGLLPTENATALPDQVMAAFSAARDVERSPHVYNKLQGQVDTGAFLTWLWDETNPDMPRNIFARPDRGTRIPFSKNDVDCVVNGNVLKLLTYSKKTEGPGYKASCEHLNHVVARKQFYFCGMYYPSYYSLPYVMANDLHAGARCLEPSRQRLLNFIIAQQHRDGSWRNSFLARPDHIQSTAWALNALLLLADPQNNFHRERVQRALKFLLAQGQRDPQGLLFWPGQVFFAATFVARFPVVWRSTAYTTALAAKALVLAEKFLN